MNKLPAFDPSRDYARYPTFSPLPAGMEERSTFARCPVCGGGHFFLLANVQTPVCMNCGCQMAQAPKTVPTAQIPACWGQIARATKYYGSGQKKDKSCGNTIILYPNGTVRSIPFERKDSFENVTFQVQDWSGITAIAAGKGYAADYLVGLCADGTVKVTFSRAEWSAKIKAWTNLIAIAASYSWIAGLCADGTIQFANENNYKEPDYRHWTNLVAIASLNHSLVGLRSDGTVMVSDSYNSIYSPDFYYRKIAVQTIQQWSNITSIAVGEDHIVALRADGSVSAAGKNDHGQCDIRFWSDVTAIAAGNNHTVLLRANGTVKAVGDNGAGQCNVKTWTNVIAIAAFDNSTAALRADGTVLCTDPNLQEILEEAYT